HREQPTPQPVPAGAPAAASGQTPDQPPRLTSTADWQRLVGRLGVGGMASQLAHHCGLIEWAAGRLTLSLDPTTEHLRSPGTEGSLRAALEAILGAPLRLEIRVVQPNQETPAQRHGREQDARREAAEATLATDPAAQRLREQFAGQWVPGSIDPVD
ncbi:MAG TPA: DNA polymerase III subunit gamma/tau C-terminal domain-containing protein, partial [Lamprocystis sp. (in: g-proteobacteria)]|nr:DNA polymerase III subunit gamma/tau C-terminal domain-containing protein [Lamprocystis sp. (in: g-proteobacteria)]